VELSSNLDPSFKDLFFSQSSEDITVSLTKDKSYGTCFNLSPEMNFGDDGAQVSNTLILYDSLPFPGSPSSHPLQTAEDLHSPCWKKFPGFDMRHERAGAHSPLNIRPKSEICLMLHFCDKRVVFILYVPSHLVASNKNIITSMTFS